MMKALLENMGLRGGELRRVQRKLDVEYSIGSAIAHGSQGAIADIFTRDGSGGIEHHDTSPYFYHAESLVRTAMALLLVLKGLEYRHNRDMGSSLYARDIELRAHEYPESYSIFTFIPWSFRSNHWSNGHTGSL
jgi:hypothetical protein